MTTPAAVQIFCVKCKTHTDTIDLEVYAMRNGRLATRGICGVADCGTRKNRIGDATGGAVAPTPAPAE